MEDTPFEISATLNATAQLLDEMDGPYEKQAVVAPSTHLENICGYDVKYPFMKGVFVQYKRPHLLDYKGYPFSFHTDHNDGEQLETLQRWAKWFPRSTFYAFPLVPKDSALNQTLDRTLFIDAACLRRGTSRVRVRTQPAGTVTSTIPRVTEIMAKVKDGGWYPLEYPSECCRMWSHFRVGLESPTGGMDVEAREQYGHEPGGEDAEEPMDEQVDRAERPVGLALYEDGEKTRRARHDDTVAEPLVDQMSQSAGQVEFWQKGLTAGLFER